MNNQFFFYFFIFLKEACSMKWAIKGVNLLLLKQVRFLPGLLKEKVVK